jgi:hypothetical protein
MPEIPKIPSEQPRPGTAAQEHTIWTTEHTIWTTAYLALISCKAGVKDAAAYADQAAAEYRQRYPALRSEE